MAKLKVFISYSHDDLATCQLVAARLKTADFDVQLDTGNIHTDELYQAISKNLNWSDVVVCIVTANWLASHECRDELVRAHERRKAIVPFRKKDIVEDDKAKMPWYLTRIPYVPWDHRSIETDVEALVLQLKKIPEAWQAGCYRDIKAIGDSIQKSAVDAIQMSASVPDWKSALTKRILSYTKGHIQAIHSNDSCALPVSHENAYFRFADPIFGQAQNIYATCIASISSFWANPDFKNDSSSYLNNQNMSAESILRLFVFSSSEELLRFNAIMKRHFDAYGTKPEKGGVFLCSSESYKALLNRWGLADDRALKQDFGILKFRNDESALYATLDYREFKFTVYDTDHDSYAIYELVCEHLERLKSLGLGETDLDSGVVRWSPQWENDSVQLTMLIDRIFPIKHQSVTHIVLLRAQETTQELTDHIRQLVGRLHRQRHVLKIQSVDMKQRCDLATHPPSDGRYAADLITREDFDYCIIMEFDNQEDLLYYYQHEVHSIEREKLYCFLNPGVKEPFEAAARLLSKRTQDRSKAFLEIEKAMNEGGYIVRCDLMTDDRMMFIKG